ncbi:MAG: hypothetical protein ACLFSA_12815 [Spirochaetaceae bacterium]
MFTSYHEIYKMELGRREDLLCCRRESNNTLRPPIVAPGHPARWGRKDKTLSRLLTTLSFGFIREVSSGKRSK